MILSHSSSEKFNMKANEGNFNEILRKFKLCLKLDGEFCLSEGKGETVAKIK